MRIKQMHPAIAHARREALRRHDAAKTRKAKAEAKAKAK
tara:strand:- start:2417 stop:2533 length:117 start_codon:yes stop_codon:yes gene_type:complete